MRGGGLRDRVDGAQGAQGSSDVQGLVCRKHPWQRRIERANNGKRLSELLPRNFSDTERRRYCLGETCDKRGTELDWIHDLSTRFSDGRHQRPR